MIKKIERIYNGNFDYTVHIDNYTIPADLIDLIMLQAKGRMTFHERKIVSTAIQKAYQ